MTVNLTSTHTLAHTLTRAFARTHARTRVHRSCLPIAGDGAAALAAAASSSASTASGYKVPHIGWGTIEETEKGMWAKDQLFKSIEAGHDVYFNHSYYFVSRVVHAISILDLCGCKSSKISRGTPLAPDSRTQPSPRATSQPVGIIIRSSAASFGRTTRMVSSFTPRRALLLALSCSSRT